MYNNALKLTKAYIQHSNCMKIHILSQNINIKCYTLIQEQKLFVSERLALSD